MEDIIKQIVGYAVWAPSGDNSQPWLFKIEKDQLLVYLERNKDNPILNFRHSGTYIAHGALIENVCIATTHFGYTARADILPNGDKDNLVAKFSFEKTTSLTESSLFPYIKTRCTNRKKYKNITLKHGQMTELIDSCKGVEGGRAIFIQDKQKIALVAKEFSLTERIALETPVIHKLFFESLVSSREEENRRGIGLYIPTLELPPPARMLFKILKYWKIQNIFNKIGFSKVAAKGNEKIYASASALCMIVIQGNSSRDFITAGRILQRLWLTATKLGLALQPVTGILFFAQRVIANDSSDFLPKHIPWIKNAHENIQRAFGVDKGTLAMHFRIGIADKPTARSLRVAPRYIVD